MSRISLAMRPHGCLPGRSALVLVMALFGVSSLGAQRPDTADRKSPGILFVHGRGQSGKQEAEVRAAFLDAFRATELRLLGGTLVPDADLAFAWYADVIDPTVAARPRIPGCRFLSQLPPTEAAAASDSLRRKLVALASALGLDEFGVRVLTSDTHKYLADVSVRCEADARVQLAARGAAWRGRPLVVVAHSMGGIVSFSALERSAQSLDSTAVIQVVQLVTIGTQVGLEPILRALEGSMVALPIAVPNNVARWTNFANNGDKLAFSAHQSFKAIDPARVPLDVSLNAPGDRHAATTYLGDTQVVSTILHAWCLAHPRAPAGCARLGP